MEKPMNDHELFAAMTGNKHKEKWEEKKTDPPFITQRDKQVTNNIESTNRKIDIIVKNMDNNLIVWSDDVSPLRWIAFKTIIHCSAQSMLWFIYFKR